MPHAKPIPGDAINMGELSWRPTGDADIVFYYMQHEIARHYAKGLLIETVLIPSLEEQALRYLRPCSQEWHNLNPGKNGVSTDFRLRGFVDWMPEAFWKEAAASMRPIGHMISAQSPILPDTLAHLAKLDLVEGEYGILCGYLEA